MVKIEDRKEVNTEYGRRKRVIIIIREMLTSTLRTLIDNPFYESFDITFMKNEKSCQNINCFFFSHKKFL